MSLSLNKYEVSGRVGQDPKITTFDNGNRVANFSIATDENYKDANGNKVERTEWHSIVARGTLVDFVERYVHKGEAFYVSGKKMSRKYTKDGVEHIAVELHARDIKFDVTRGEVEGDHTPTESSDEMPF